MKKKGKILPQQLNLLDILSSGNATIPLLNSFNNKNSHKSQSKEIKEFHKKSSRHVLCLEADLLENDKRAIFHQAELLRKADNDLTRFMQNNLYQMGRTRKYRELIELYQKHNRKLDDPAKQADMDAQKKEIVSQLEELRKDYNVTWDCCRKEMEQINKRYKLHSVFALTRAEDIWKGVEKCLFSDGKRLHFRKHGDLPCLRAKQINRCITVVAEDGRLVFKTGDIKFSVFVKDNFQRREIKSIIHYLQNSAETDSRAVSTYSETGKCLNTFRPCYVSLVCETIRNKLRVFVHITLEGNAKPKYDRTGKFRHPRGIGNVGCDIGTQTIAYTTDSYVGLKNLAERGNSIRKNECQERILKRQLDRSRRANNPGNYNEDGTCRKGKKTWHNSKHYRANRKKLADKARKAAINRHLAINEDVNKLRSYGDVFITEEKNAAKLKKKAKRKIDPETGKYRRRKRFGKSIQRRCPGYFQQQAKNKFERTGGLYVEVPRNYCASQFNHITGINEKKHLSRRMFKIAENITVQRDWYSSFLLYNINSIFTAVDAEKCKTNFNLHYKRELALIENIKANRIHVMNSGIKFTGSRRGTDSPPCSPIREQKAASAGQSGIMGDRRINTPDVSASGVQCACALDRTLNCQTQTCSGRLFHSQQSELPSRKKDTGYTVSSEPPRLAWG